MTVSASLDCHEDQIRQSRQSSEKGSWPKPQAPTLLMRVAQMGIRVALGAGEPTHTPFQIFQEGRCHD